MTFDSAIWEDPIEEVAFELRQQVGSTAGRKQDHKQRCWCGGVRGVGWSVRQVEGVDRHMVMVPKNPSLPGKLSQVTLKASWP